MRFNTGRHARVVQMGSATEGHRAAPAYAAPAGETANRPLDRCIAHPNRIDPV